MTGVVQQAETPAKNEKKEPLAEAQEPSTKARDLIRLFGDAEFECGEWDNPEDGESYESVWHDARMKRNALYAYIAELEQRSAPPVFVISSASA